MTEIRYNAKERLYVYAGTVLGAVAPVAAARYTVFRSESSNPIEEVLSWGLSTIVAGPVGALTGVSIGKIFADDSVRERISGLENRE